MIISQIIAFFMSDHSTIPTRWAAYYISCLRSHVLTRLLYCIPSNMIHKRIIGSCQIRNHLAILVPPNGNYLAGLSRQIGNYLAGLSLQTAFPLNNTKDKLNMFFCSSVSLPHSALSWILSKVEILVSSRLSFQLSV